VRELVGPGDLLSANLGIYGGFLNGVVRNWGFHFLIRRYKVAIEVFYFRSFMHNLLYILGKTSKMTLLTFEFTKMTSAI
jgi:hypothetical protein